MKKESNSLVQKLWSYCNILRDDGLSYPDYVEQLTYLLFLGSTDILMETNQVSRKRTEWHFGSYQIFDSLCRLP
jgi:type I restriction-modification system DNA methylase subunit